MMQKSTKNALLQKKGVEMSQGKRPKPLDHPQSDPTKVSRFRDDDVVGDINSSRVKGPVDKPLMHFIEVLHGSDDTSGQDQPPKKGVDNHPEENRQKDTEPTDKPVADNGKDARKQNSFHWVSLLEKN